MQVVQNNFTQEICKISMPNSPYKTVPHVLTHNFYQKKISKYRKKRHNKSTRTNFEQLVVF